MALGNATLRPLQFSSRSLRKLLMIQLNERGARLGAIQPRVHRARRS